ncbi:2'-5' RNA ligase family protein [Terriglobus aquaticus]|uniref:2'-5' RNA ligase family protein n=1 Tax=Terriglobus aquaticus TaxID=940139 RepID=A0ABW9KHA1_9BACT|nr:2'-5' RNA ligase family protein [Terriglobus aquaticus]
MSSVLTLALDSSSQQRFELLRQQWFPPERNQIPAHLTLFHTLPETEAVAHSLRAIATATRPFHMEVSGLRSLGRGVAFFLEAPAAKALHRDLSNAFQDELSPQDRQGFRPHVVVQNKVEPAVARETLAVLQAGFVPWRCQAVGLDWWRYLGGPWQLLQRFAFPV